MTTVIRVVQVILLLAAVGACGYAAVMVIEASNDANSECFIQEQQRSGLVRQQEQPLDVCVGLEQFQVEATGAIAMAIAGLTAAAGAAALNGMAQPRAAQPAPRAAAAQPAAGFPTATPPGGVQQPRGYPQAGQYPPGQYPQAGQGQYGQQPPG